MTNNNSAPAVTKASVTGGEMLALLNAAGLKPSPISPLKLISGQPAQLNAARHLQTAGIIDAAGRPTAGCIEALNILANPAAELDIIWGSPDAISLSRVYNPAGQDRSVSFTADTDKYNFSYFLSSQDITDLMAQRLAFSDIKENAPLNIKTTPAAVPVFFALLDIYRESQLRSALERRQENIVTATLEEVNRVAQEAKMETSLNWYAPVAFSVLPLDTPATEATLEEGYRNLQKEGIIGRDGELSGGFSALAIRAFPLAGFFGIKMLTAGGSAFEKTQLALFRGLSTLLLVQLTTENNKDLVSIDSIATAELPELLFNLGLRQSEAPAPAPPTTAAAPPAAGPKFCSKCGNPIKAGEKFCSKCGTPLTTQAVPKFCSKCGNPAKSGEKFCSKCGAPLG